MSVNKAILIGNLGSDPDIRTLESGKQVASFSLATSEQYKDKTTGERKSVTEWHKVVLWNALAGIADKYLKKGSKIYLEGKIKTRAYDDSNGGKKYTTEIIGDTITLLGEKPQAAQELINQESSHQKSNVSPVANSDNGSDDLPF